VSRMPAENETECDISVTGQRVAPQLGGTPGFVTSR